MTDDQINEQIKFTDMMKEKSKKGFASMVPWKQKEIARKGGLKISQDKEWMKHIGQRGGQITQARNRQDKINLENSRY